MSTPLEMLDIQRWMSNAACKGNTEGDWFPEQPGRTPAIKLAMDICNRCPVKIECLEYAMIQPNLHGIWGGLSARKRGALRAKRNKGE
jgi:WhiB family redox-sensing transcriptional regulator